MMNSWELPTSLCVGGENWNIRTDFRAILDILKYFNDKEYDLDEQWEICLDILYEDFANMPWQLHRDAAEKATEFIDYGQKDDGKPHPRLYDWEQDASLIIPAVNQALNTEIRSIPYMHWYTFLDVLWKRVDDKSLWSHILNLRIKKAKGKKLEKWEREFYNENKDLIELKTKREERSDEEKEALRELFGLKK